MTNLPNQAFDLIAFRYALSDRSTLRWALHIKQHHKHGVSMSNDDLEEDRETRIENLKRKMKKGDSPLFSGVDAPTRSRPIPA